MALPTVDPPTVDPVMLATLELALVLRSEDFMRIVIVAIRSIIGSTLGVGAVVLIQAAAAAVILTRRSFCAGGFVEWRCLD